jgi:hypothetical protein
VLAVHGGRTQTSLTANTVFDASKLAPADWLLAMYLLAQTKAGISARSAAR